MITKEWHCEQLLHHSQHIRYVGKKIAASNPGLPQSLPLWRTDLSFVGMRYLIEPEFRKVRTRSPVRSTAPYAAELRRDLSQRNLRWALDRGYCYEASLGSVPAILYREDDQGIHGNFLAAAYHRIQQTPAWAARLTKVHTSARRTLLSRDPDRRELDSSNSSDALLMNIFCHPATLATPSVRLLLGIDAGIEPIFGYRPGVALVNGRFDCTEIDMKLGNLFIEAKLTEYDFQTAPLRLIERYRGLEVVFNIDELDISDGIVRSYQLIRGVLAAYASPDYRFCVLCDSRRPDLVADWHRVIATVKPYDLRCRLQLLTWQELAATLSDELQTFLEIKFGIV
jgi:hypothetical protein